MLQTSLINRFDLYFFSLLVLSIIIAKLLKERGRKDALDRLFIALLAMNFLIIVVDSVTTLLDGMPGQPIRLILSVSMALDYILQMMIGLVWFWYIRRIVFSFEKSSPHTCHPEIIPGLAYALIAIVSTRTGWFFYFDANNVYHRGFLFFLANAICYFYLVISYALVIAHRKNLDAKNILALFCFALLPAICGAIQVLLYGTMLTWPGLTLSLLIIYLGIQSELLMIDHLTGVNNRRSLDYTLRRKIAEAKDSDPFAALLIDLDDFKSINDRFGHPEGDKALAEAGLILSRCFHHNDFIARYGGDEFFVIVDVRHSDNLDVILERFNSQVDEWNRTCGKPWKLSFSTGSAIYVASEQIDGEGFLKKLDSLLYIDKSRER